MTCVTNIDKNRRVYYIPNWTPLNENPISIDCKRMSLKRISGLFKRNTVGHDVIYSHWMDWHTNVAFPRMTEINPRSVQQVIDTWDKYYIRHDLVCCWICCVCFADLCCVYSASGCVALQESFPTKIQKY